MEIEFNNTGLIKSANIKLEGLTVIGGLNSVGKSFLGKTIYCAVKAANYQPSKPVYFSNLHKKFSTLLNYLTKKNHIDTNSNLNFIKAVLDLSLKSGNPNSYQAMLLFVNKELTHSTSYLNDEKAVKMITEFRNLDLESLEVENLEEDEENKEEENKKRIIEHDNLIKSIFKGQYNNLLTSTKTSEVSFRHEHKDYLSISVEDNKTKNVTVLETLPFNDVTIIETPIILSLVGFIRDSLAFSDKQSKLLAAYILDLVKKIVEGGYDTPTDNVLYNSIKEIIEGQLIVEGDQVLYKDKAGNAHNINNTASGIKSFGLLQLLLAGGTINPNSILIIDEPEVHLHPEWQLEYVKIMIALVKNDIPILITTHSPYFLEALKVFSDKEGIAAKTNFYLGEPSDEGSVFEDVTQNLEHLFEKFSSPMIKLIIEK